ncbi:hypothetical protein FE783_21675 [Paenibacillus mesophilus]|nr:hypothetical protein FE783_21675 [Paenibacillus mesophilus]
MTGLTNGTAYTFTVVATNGVGPSVSSAPSASVTPVGEPNAPTGVTAAAGDGQATISFTAPASDGGSAITGYTATASPGGRTATGNGSPITMTGLTNGTAYTFTVVATNGVGPSLPSASSAAVTPSASATVPGAPTGVTAVAGNGQATVSFTAPGSDGGSAITSYTVTSSPGGLTATGSGSPITVTGLTNGTAYTFTVVATNDVGPSVPSAPSAAVTPTAAATVPSAPTGVTAVAGNGQATISFTAPASDGGSAITSYTVTASPGGRTATGSGSPITMTGLTNGTAYTFTVVATNGVGQSVPSAPSTSVTPIAAATVPGAPTGVTAVAGSGQATISFTAPSSDGGSAITGYTVTSNPGGLTASGSGSPITVTGLTYGTAYTFTVVATNGVGPSVPSAPSASVTPTAPAGEPGAPILQLAGVGDARVQLVWNAVAGSTGYKVYQSVTSGTYGTEIATVSGSVYGYNATGLVNGTTYYFVVKATNAGIDSAASNTVSAIPITVPSAPTNVAAVAGNGQATVTFTAPANNGGSSITGYVVTTAQGNISASGTASPITVTGLTNGISYTFTVKAINNAGSSAPSVESNAVTPSSPSSGGGSGGSDDGGGSTPSQPAAPSTTPSNAPETSNTGVEILVNGKVEYAGTATTTKVDGQTVTTLTVDQKKLEDKLALEGRNAVVTIAANAKSDIVIGELNGQMVKNMEDKQAVLEIKTDTATYKLPAAQININAISEQIGKTVALQDIKVRIEIAAPTAGTVKVVENTAEKGKFSIVVPPLDFTVKGIYGDTVFEVERFNAYVERTIAIPDGVNPNNITTGVIVDPDGTVRHVPTKIVVIDGKYYAKINSLSNSTYTVVWHPLEFGDAADHWAKRAVNDMGSRMVIEGTGNGMFHPDRDITRAEFAAIIVRGLGLKLEQGTAPFADVKAADWYASAVKTAYSHQLIDGFEDGTFRPNDTITREQAMAIIAKAMAITGLKAKLPVQAADAAFRSYLDAADISVWAKNGLADCLQAGIVSGRSGSELAPKASITRAEVAVIVQRLLQKSELI